MSHIEGIELDRRAIRHVVDSLVEDAIDKTSMIQALLLVAEELTDEVSQVIIDNMVVEPK